MKNYKVHLQYAGTCQLYDKIWFSNGGFNGLFSLNIADFSIEYKHRIPFLDSQVQWAYADCCCTYHNKLFFFPGNCKEIMIYDVEKDDIQAVSIFPIDGSEIYRTHGIVQLKEQIWIFPQKPIQGIFILNLSTLQIEKDLELCKLFEGKECIYTVISLNETEIAVLLENNTILQIDIKKKQKIYSKHFDSDMDIWTIRYDSNNFWLLQGNSTDVYEWNQREDKLIKYKLLEAEWIASAARPYSDIVFCNDQIILMNCRLKYIMKIDKETHTISKAVDYPEGFRFIENCFRINEEPAITAIDVIDNKLLLHPMLGNMLLIYDVEKNDIKGKELVVTSDEVPFLEKIIGQGLQRNGIFYEAEDIGELEVFLDAVVDQKCTSSNEKDDKGIGQKIYSSVIETL